ncbi:unnamed protein product [Auanema sp. JU1783]|nr:unnamed protein product [Auanema sp. JU1783]
MEQERDFILRPAADQKFRADQGESILKRVMENQLAGQTYDNNTVEMLSQSVSEEIRTQLKGLHLPNYKYIVQVTIAEQRGQAANIVSQCFWDSDCDVLVHHFYDNGSLWSKAVVFAVFHY